MLHEHRLPRHRADRGRAWIAPAAAVLLAVLVLTGIAVKMTSRGGGHGKQADASLAARTRTLAWATDVLAGAPDAVAEGVADRLFASAPVVVVANPAVPADLATAARQSMLVHAPLLLTSAGTATAAPGDGTEAAAHTTALLTYRHRGGTTVVGAVLREQILSLGPRAVLAVGLDDSALAAQLPGISVVTNPAMLPATSAPAPLGHLVLLVKRRDSSAATLAAIATARVAGAQVLAIRGTDPGTDPAAIVALAAARPRHVLAVGSGFGPPGRLASRIALAETGRQLPGGGQVLFPMRMLVALYGNPGTPALGVLGQQGLQASIARARHVAAAYRALSRVPVIPTFEIIATVAQAHRGNNGDYSYETPIAFLRPWVRRATAAGMYVILDLQPGRASLLAQAKSYEPLLKLPNVGLALDAEWKLQPGQLPLQQIGSVSINEVNSVIRWLAALTARYQLPQKLLVLHQFRLSMIQNERRLDTSHQDLAILIHMDGQGTPGEKQQTWDAITAAAPPGVFFGWKNFYVKDHPMISPGQTLARTPRLSMVSYQ